MKKKMKLRKNISNYRKIKKNKPANFYNILAKINDSKKKIKNSQIA